MAQTKWGVIYCPREGLKNPRPWNTICNYLREKGVHFDSVQSESQGSVERLASMLTQNGYRTIIVIGGDAALGDALNGMLSATSPDGVEPALGVIPNGFGNDFAKYWGYDVNNYKGAIDQLIFHRLRRVDVGHVSLTRRNGSVTTRHFLNCVNIGLAAAIINVRRKTNRFWGIRTLSYLSSAVILIFKRMLFKMEFRVGGENVRHKEMSVCVGSATGYGQTPSAVPYNGMLDVTAVSHPQITKIFHGLWLLFTGRFLTHESVKAWRCKQIRFSHIDKAPVSIDGRVFHHHVEALDISIEQEKINFIIPS